MSRRRRVTRPSQERPGGPHGGVGRGWLLGIFLAALAYRALCFSAVGDHPLFRYPVIDAGAHDAWARRIAAGDWLGHGPDDVFKPPLYPYFLATLYGLFGRDIALVQWAQYLLGSASCVLVAVLGGRLLGPAAGRLAGFLSAAYAPYVFFECQLLTPALSNLLNVAAVVLLVAREGFPGRRRLVAAGALLGLSAGARPDVLLPAALVLLGLGFHHRRSPWRQLAWGAVCVGVPVAGVPAAIAVRNYSITGQFILVSSNGGINFYTGNSSAADGVSAVPVGLRWERLVARVPQKVLERPAAASRWWSRAAWREIRAAPGAALARLGRKALAFWSRREFRNNICYHFMQRVAWPLRVSPLQFAVVLPLAVCGAIGLWRSKVAMERLATRLCVLWVAGYWVGGIAFFVTARFRLPAVPFLILPAAWGVLRIVDAARQGRWRSLGGYAAAVLLVGAVSWPMWLGPPRDGWVRDYVNLGNSLVEAGDRRGAQQAYRRALECQADDADAHYMLARSLLQDRPAEAIEHFEAAQRAMPDAPDVLLSLAEARLAQGDAAHARELLEELLRLAETSNLWPRRAAWATAHVRLADLEAAEASDHWEKAWAIDPRTAAEAAFLHRRELSRALDVFLAEARKTPWDWYAHANCGTLLLELGRAREAAAAYRRAVRLAPEREALRFHLARALLLAGERDEAARLLDGLLGQLPPCPLRGQVEQLRGQVGARQPTRQRVRP